MGDDWDYDDDFMFEDPDYIYAEESWTLADELASNALPHPAWPEMLDDDYSDYDMYEYFEDIEYGNDDYFDKEETLQLDPLPGDKRKRGKGAVGTEVDKRRRILDFDFPPVLWIPLSKVYSLDVQQPEDVKSLPSYALLPDWKERLKDSHGFQTATRTKDIKRNSSDTAMDSDKEEPGEDSWEDEDEEEDIDNEDDEMEGPLDPNILKSILAAKGIGGAEQGAFMESLLHMMQQGGEIGGDMLENLTSTLLGQASEGGRDSSMTQWLSQKGISLEEEEEEEEIESSEHQEDSDTQTPNHASRSESQLLREVNSSKDSVAEAEKLHISAANRGFSSLSIPPTNMSEERPVAGKKRKQVLFTPAGANGATEEDSVLELRPGTKRIRRDEPTMHAGNRFESFKSKQAASTNGNKGSLSPRPDLPLETSDLTEQPASELSSRKRKATQEADPPVEKAKKQQRGGFAAPTASSQRKASIPSTKQVAEPLKKTTRSGKKRD